MTEARSAVKKTAVTIFDLKKITKNNAAASIVDAFVTSGVMFSVQLALIWFAAKAEYGTYTLFMSYIVVGQAILSAVFGAPLITLAAALPGSEREAVLTIAIRHQALAALTIALAAGLLLWFVFELGGIAAFTILAAFIGLALREIQRVIWAIELRLERAVASSVAFGLLTMVILAGFYFATGAIAFVDAMAAIGIAGIATAAGPLISRARLPSNASTRLFHSSAIHARWTFPGVLVIWLQNNFYPTVLALLISVSAVAEVSAARMAAMPYIVATGGLLRLNQANFGRQLASDRPQAALASAKRWASAHVALGAFLALALGLAFASGLQSLLPAKYPMLLALGALWLSFAGISSARGAMSALYHAEGRYREVFLVNLVTFPVALGGMFVLVPIWGVAGSVVPLIAAEALFLVILLWKHGRSLPRTRSDCDALDRNEDYAV